MTSLEAEITQLKDQLLRMAGMAESLVVRAVRALVDRDDDLARSVTAGDEPLDELAKASESEDEVDPLGCLRLLLIKLFEQLALDAKIRRINEILIHKCEFTDAMCDLRQQRQSAYLTCNGRIELSLGNAVHRGQLPANLHIPRAVISLHGYIDGIVAQWLLVPDSFALADEAEALVDAALDMLRLSPALQS